VPFVDLAPQTELVVVEVGERWRQVIVSGEFVGGPVVAEFERRWADYCGADHCVALGNGTDAVELACRVRLTGLERVSVPANTFIATVEGIVRAGLEPCVVDVDHSTLLADHADVAVALYGQHGQRGRVVDAAQAHGASFDGLRQVGDVMAWSFYPSKPLGAWGDAGAVTTDDPFLARRIRMLANHGGGPGSTNSRMDPLQAAVLLAKLPYLDGWNTQRAAAALYYRHVLEPLVAAGRLGVVYVNPRSSHVYHLFVVRVREPEWVLAAMANAGVEVRRHYPEMVQFWSGWGGELDGEATPEAAMGCREVLSLPLWAGITQAQQDRVVEVLEGALQ
jgi:dTDP-4-amino-4,6-dideoxygalactose transaminase